jgi:acetate kinase
VPALRRFARALVLNAGSSSLKWSLLDAAREGSRDGPELLDSGNERWGEDDPAEPVFAHLADRLRGLPPPDAIGHRLVHGGARFRQATAVDDDARRELAALAEVDPLHTARALAGVDAAFATFPGLPEVAAFDTTFHSTIPDAAALYPVPREWTDRYGLRRYGFHGLSVAYAVRRAAPLLGSPPRRLAVCHLGSGCSATAVLDGRSVDTTMGFTPLEGLMMATRSGSVDPGILLYLQRERGLTAEEVEDALNRRSGLLGVSGVSADLREVQKAADAGDPRARLAHDMFVHRLRRELGGLIATLGGLDALVFTGGIGEHAHQIRAEAVVPFADLGAILDPAKNAAAISGKGDAEITAAGARVRTLVIEAREDLSVLAEMERVLG